MKFIRHTSGFTLIELVIAMTIFAIMSLAITSIYIQTTYMGQKMRNTRYLSETAREITERLAEDVRTRTLTGSNISGHSYEYWNGTSGYTSSGTEILRFAYQDAENRRITYLYGKANGTGFQPCSNPNKINPSIHCGLYRIIGQVDTPIDAINLVDSFIPDEDKKRVKIEDLKFYVSGDGVTTERKVTLVMTLALMPRIGVPPGMIGQTRLHVQTTLSERFFK